MTEKRKLVMATNNAAKLREARAIAGDRLEILSLADIGFNRDIPETADTLEGNALLKVRAVKEACDLDVFADDTGLMVDALGGAPGVYSARYAGEECNSDKNIDLLLKKLEGKENRDARFRTAIALSLDGEEHLFEGEVEGSIANRRSGSNGFGYDPVFICTETRKCFAEMTDEEKNAVSHRGRAVSAMMRWILSLCMMLCACLPMAAAEWTLFNSFDEGIQNVFDTQDRTYFLVQAQTYVPSTADNGDKLFFLYCLDKKTDEFMPYNIMNFLSGSLIRNANYNAVKKYLMLVYDDMTIDLLYDNGDVHTVFALRDFSNTAGKEVNSISFDPDSSLAYLATNFGFLSINDEKYEIAESHIYDRSVEYIVRSGGLLILISDGKLYTDNADSNHLDFADFKEPEWSRGQESMNAYRLSSDMALVSFRMENLPKIHLVTFPEGGGAPSVVFVGNYAEKSVVENSLGLFLSRPYHVTLFDRSSGKIISYDRDEEDRNILSGSWDMKDYFFAKSREGFYSKRLDGDNLWTRTRQIFSPNSPAAFRSDNLKYVPQFGMMVASHGISQNFSNHNNPNPLQLSALRGSDWTEYGLPYHDASQSTRLVNPCGFAQDPDNPDIFYFGSVLNGIMRYNIRDFSSMLHMTRVDDNPSMEGHVTVAPNHATWGNAMMMLNPSFDTYGNLLFTHLNTDSSDAEKYTAELWMWTPEMRRASQSPETFQPFIKLNLEGVYSNKISLAIPMKSSGARNLVPVFFIQRYNSPFVVYDHNGTPEDVSDDRQVAVPLTDMKDSDGKLEGYHYIYCALEDPETGLVWVGTDNGIFTFDPRVQFTEKGSVIRIKVSRNDGTSLADYLLSGAAVSNIAIDGDGRKWFSLNGGGLVCTSADGRTILQEITSGNSMLPSDNVYAACYNPDNNSMMIATSAGLCEMKLNGNAPDSVKTSVYAYPNPVRPDYFGYVTITGLEDDAIVKITDAAGNLVRELGPAANGQVQWDACNARLDRVASGVYFVLASSGAGGGGFSEVSKILVVKN